mmetsp:Transcript_47304/g.133424  ORF Transcript_47304/g.133424 Transcript_47304/m.133424 type:complete len:220 (+) Transcript_47304:665-1324(+)
MPPAENFGESHFPRRGRPDALALCSRAEAFRMIQSTFRVGIFSVSATMSCSVPVWSLSCAMLHSTAAICAAAMPSISLDLHMLSCSIASRWSKRADTFRMASPTSSRHWPRTDATLLWQSSKPHLSSFSTEALIASRCLSNIAIVDSHCFAMSADSSVWIVAILASRILVPSRSWVNACSTLSRRSSVSFCTERNLTCIISSSWDVTSLILPSRCSLHS